MKHPEQGETRWSKTHKGTNTTNPAYRKLGTGSFLSDGMPPKKLAAGKQQPRDTAPGNSGGRGNEHLMPMNPTSRAIFQSVLSSDPLLTGPERAVLEQLLRGETRISTLGTGRTPSGSYSSPEEGGEAARCKSSHDLAHGQRVHPTPRGDPTWNLAVSVLGDCGIRATLRSRCLRRAKPRGGP